MFRSVFLCFIVVIGALRSPGPLLSYSIITIPLHITIILIITHKSFNHTLNYLIQAKFATTAILEFLEDREDTGFRTLTNSDWRAYDLPFAEICSHNVNATEFASSHPIED